MEKSADLAKSILDTALELAEEKTWEKLRLHDIATTLNLSLNQVRAHYPQKDDLAEAWYDRADGAMLDTGNTTGFLDLPMEQRLHQLIMSWLDALASHKQISRDMLMYKLEPGHVHLQVLGILRISRTVQWIREAAHQDSSHLFRILEEIGLTSLYLMTFSHWLFDQSDKQKATREFLKQKLQRAGQCMTTLGGTSNRPARKSENTTPG
jgi:ubiquinone biosynthesis protein COQ9